MRRLALLAPPHRLPSPSSSSSSSSTPPPPTDASPVTTSRTDTARPAVPHVFVIAMENESAGAIYGSSHAPYINGVLVPTYASGVELHRRAPVPAQ